MTITGRIRLPAVIVLALLALFVLPVRVCAEGGAGTVRDELRRSLSIAEFPGEWEDKFVISGTEDTRHKIKSMDISENGRLMIFLDNGFANIYNSDGRFLYAVWTYLKAETAGFWLGEQAAVWTAGEDIVVTLGKDGVTGAYRLRSDADTDRLWRGLIKTDEVSYDDMTYTIEGRKCVMRRGGETVRVICDSTGEINVGFLLFMPAALIVLIVIVRKVFRSVFRFAKDDTEEYLRELGS